MENITVFKPVTIQEIMNRLKPIIAKVLRISEIELDEDIPLINYGISSLMTIVLIQKINKAFDFSSMHEEMSMNEPLNSLAALISRKLNSTL
ncbi:MAG TPA: acyl carrier protein [Gammaproteobacteria bacterium]|nr:acyl carrier protein [Gammaproteobacteria bacterium]